MSELQAVAFTLEDYLTGSERSRAEALSRLVRIARVLSKQGMQGELAWQLLQVLRKCLGRREGLGEVVRRWLALVDAILDMDWRKNKLAFYR